MKFQVRAHGIAGLFDRLPRDIRVLSLDCFDTLLWRGVQAPRDIFCEIDLPGGGMEPRSWAEGAARRIARNREGRGEIGLRDVYRRLLPNAGEDEIAGREARELEIEGGHIFAFAPVVALMRAAAARGLRIVIVSDMYLSEAQIRGLIVRAAGEDVLALVERLFVSSSYGCGKAGGLFDHVLNALGEKPEHIVHVGDNPEADYEAAARHGMHAVHFRQFDAEAEQRLRLEAAAAVMIDPAVRITRPAVQLHRAAASLRAHDDAAYALGHDVIGPAIRAFALWLKAEVDELSAKLGKPVRPLFMMRDGWLPYRCFDEMFPEAGARPVEISRFIAARACLHDMDALREYVIEWLDRLPLAALARQLNVYEHELGTMLKKGALEDQRRAFSRAVLGPELSRKILNRAAAFGDRFDAHLRAAGVAEGDAVMLVDVGYNGTVQNILTPVLAKRMGLSVAGRYLFLREEQVSGLDKKGMLDVRNYETRTLHALATCVAVIEQLCNIPQGSTVDYARDGSPVREALDAKGAQNATRDRVQAACLDHVRTADHGIHRAPASDTLDARVRAAAATLARLFFLPGEAEVALFATFDQDVNMGTKQSQKLLDEDEATDGLRRRGPSYMNGVLRMYVPGEIRRHGLPLTLSLFSSLRFGLDLRSSDFDAGGVKLPAILADATSQTAIELIATPTCDGFYRVLVPVGAGRFTAAIQLGRMCEVVQVQDIRFHRVADFDSDTCDAGTPAIAMPDAMTALAPDLYAADPAGMLIVPPPPAGSANMMLALVFRPVRRRAAAMVEQARAA